MVEIQVFKNSILNECNDEEQEMIISVSESEYENIDEDKFKNKK